MSATANHPQPFFTDPRTIVQKLETEERNWIPTKPAENCPPMIAGLVLDRGTYLDLNNEPRQTLRVLADDGSIVWSVIGFHGWLETAIRTKNPRVGDYVIVLYKGQREKPRKAGETAPYEYRLEVERNPDNSAQTPLPPEHETATADPVNDEPPLSNDGPPLPDDGIPF